MRDFVTSTGWALLLLFCAAACSTTQHLDLPPGKNPWRAGNVVAIEPLESYSRLTLRAMLWWQGFANRFDTEQGIQLYRLQYRTIAPDGRVVPASALLVLPDAPPPYRGVVSWQHGTASLRTAAPSTPDVVNGLLPGVVFGGHGYVVVAPDYLGFGLSNEPHPYYHTPTSARVVVDALVAARSVLRASHIDWPEHLFLAGFSQGGHTSLAAARSVEAGVHANLRIDGVASVAGPIDLAGVGFPESLAGRSRYASLYIAWIATTYARVYGEPLDSVLLPPWSSAAPSLFDGRHDGDTVVASLPTQPRSMLTQAVLRAVETDDSHWFVDRLRQNGLQDWLPALPVRLYFGSGDVDVPHADALSFVRRATAAGAAVAAIDVGPVAHDTSILEAAPRIIAWFDELTAGAEEGRGDRFIQTRK